jgi:hypothetical protein
VGFTTGSREVPGKKENLRQEIIIIIIIIIIIMYLFMCLTAAKQGQLQPNTKTIAQEQIIYKNNIKD